MYAKNVSVGRLYIPQVNFFLLDIEKIIEFFCLVKLVGAAVYMRYIAVEFYISRVNQIIPFEGFREFIAKSSGSQEIIFITKTDGFKKMKKVL